MKTTNWKTYNEGSSTYRIRATYGMRKIGAQEPYFSITCDIEERKKNNRWYESGGGAAHALIKEHFPELAHLIRWHLFSYPSGPMHYYANGVYFWQQATGRVARSEYDHDPLDAFKSTIVYGVEARGEDKLARLRETRASDTEIRVWLEKRLPLLRAAFEEVMAGEGIALTTDAEVRP